MPVMVATSLSVVAEAVEAKRLTAEAAPAPAPAPGAEEEEDEVKAAEAAPLAALDPEPLITFAGIDVGDIGLFLRSYGGAGQASSFNAFRRDAAAPPCCLHRQCAAAVPANVAFVLGRIILLEDLEDGSGLRVATIVQLQHDSGGAQAAYAPPVHPRPDDAISFRRIGVDRIVLFFLNKDHEYVAFKQPGPSHWFLGRESKDMVTPAGTAAPPQHVFGRMIFANEFAASAERNPYNLAVGTPYFVAMIQILGEGTADIAGDQYLR